MSATRTRDLGELGVVRDNAPVHFGWFGVQMQAHPGATELVLSDFMEKASTVKLPDDIDLEDLAGTLKNLSPADQIKAQTALLGVFPMVKDFARKCVHEDNFAEFWRLALAKGQNSADIMAVCSALIDKVSEATTGRPTGPSRSSGSTRRRTAPKSKAKPSSRAGSFEPASYKVIKRLEKAGRADLAEIHQIRQEALLASV